MDGYLDRLVGNTSPAALLVSSFFWSWFDIVPFSPALFIAKEAPADPSLFIISFISGTLFLALSAASGRLRASILKPKVFAVFALVGGCFGTVLAWWGIQQDFGVFVLGCVLVGSFQGAGILLAGSVATCEGTTNALFHLAAALPLNIVSVLLAMFLKPLASIVFTALLPLLALLCFKVYLSRDRNEAALESVRTVYPKPSGKGKRRGKVLGCDVSFVVMVVAVTVAFGFVNFHATLAPTNENPYVGFVPVFWRAVTSFAVLVGYLRFSWRPYSILRIAMILVSAGLVLDGAVRAAGIPGMPLLESPVFVGLACFDLLIWAIMIMSRYRSGTSLLMIICVVETFDELGFLVGALLGLSVGTESGPVSVCCIGLGCALLLCALLFFSGETSLKRMLSNEAVSLADVQDVPDEGEGLSFASVCEERSRKLASRYFLTARETVVLGLLLAGRSAPFVASHLHVSESTVKTHVRHIYTKLDVHNRQELLDTAFPPSNA